MDESLHFNYNINVEIHSLDEVISLLMSILIVMDETISVNCATK